MIVETVSGSRYEVDVEGKRARRLEGPAPATQRMPDGIWRVFSWMLPPTGPILGKSMLFLWADESEGPPAAKDAEPGTYTSPVMLVC